VASISPKLRLQGKRFCKLLTKCLRQVENIKQVGEEYSNPYSGKLAIATTHTQARYRLPPVIDDLDNVILK
jgi:LysR family cys regulon transcriptional activator